MGYLTNDDPEIARIIGDEESRVQNTLDLIAAENQQNHRQHRIRKMTKNLWIPPELERKGREILSYGEPGGYRPLRETIDTDEGNGRFGFSFIKRF